MRYCVRVCVPCQPLTAMPECSQTPRRQRPDYLADFTSGSSTDNSCSSSDEEEEERRKAGGGGRGEKREKKVSYDLGESKEKNLAERSGKAASFNSGPFSCSLSCLLGVLFTLCILLYLLILILFYILYLECLVWFSCFLKFFLSPVFSRSTLYHFLLSTQHDIEQPATFVIFLYKYFNVNVYFSVQAKFYFWCQCVLSLF